MATLLDTHQNIIQTEDEKRGHFKKSLQADRKSETAQRAEIDRLNALHNAERAASRKIIDEQTAEIQRLKRYTISGVSNQ
jgi:hypothetical protein